MAKQGMSRPSTPHGPKNDVSPVPQLQGKAKSGKEKAKSIISGTTGTSQKVWHEKPISKGHGILRIYRICNSRNKKSRAR